LPYLKTYFCLFNDPSEGKTTDSEFLQRYQKIRFSGILPVHFTSEAVKKGPAGVQAAKLPPASKSP
jgi:hypothetical protein